jgi:thioredoxin reductase (NADPH)
LVATGGTAGRRDEEFHIAITEDLGEWAWTTAPTVEAVRIVSADDRRADEINALLDLLGVPSGIHAPDSELAARIAGRSPQATWRILVEVMGSTVLADPTNRDLAVAFGVSVEVGSTVFDVAVVGCGPASLEQLSTAPRKG